MIDAKYDKMVSCIKPEHGAGRAEHAASDTFEETTLKNKNSRKIDYATKEPDRQNEYVE